VQGFLLKAVHLLFKLPWKPEFEDGLSISFTS